MTQSKIGLRMSDALLIVDLQRDFCAGGKLEVPGAEEIVPIVNALAAEAHARGALIVVSRDLHPADHLSFAAFGGDWPQHCVRGTRGAELHPGLHLPEGALFVAKARRAEREQASTFDATGLAEELRRRSVERIFIVGLAEDVCVKASAIDAARLGFATHVLRAATRPVTPEGGARARAEMRAAGVMVIEA
ncbi:MULTISPECIES: isochorismatase family protein [Methylosinus]|uniref:nicotinamidase n=1 Tax=Methylosinus trichosporium (strain ATCC 35070 / NCIMB 11131 / UNIQEM 75 / OB3b) TaxID=595536 RepID=A0A2D2D5S8_METT3|nr:MULTISPECIES: isochorismatase family protein [Methylosinus]ATQ70358.1 nicotinamidase [Methylosinus trichosporium OB3b]OBS53995.1 nicotinamidase [Methylosinus sp. 3S-1]